MPDIQCPQCKSVRVVLGELVQGWVIGEPATLGFRALGARFASLRKGVRLPLATCACAECGLVWNRLDPAQLADHLMRFDADRARRWIESKVPEPY